MKRNDRRRRASKRGEARTGPVHVDHPSTTVHHPVVAASPAPDGVHEARVDVLSKRPVVATLERLARVLRRRVQQRGAALGLSVMETRVLLFVSDAPLPGPTAGGIGRHFGKAAATVSEAVRSLVRRGLLVRRADPTDRRLFRLALTERGSDLAEELGRWMDPVRRLVAQRPPEEVRAVELFLMELIRELDG